MTSDLHLLDISVNDAWVTRAADVMAAAIEAAINRTDRCVMALSGGSTPAPVFAELADRDLLWELVTILQVDERMVPHGDPARNLTAQEAALGHLGARWLPFPIDELLSCAEPEQAARRCAVLDRYALALVELAGDPPVLDLVHLGLGDDGHTASLVPGDPLLHQMRDYAGVTGVYQGSRRVTLTRPVLDRARMVVWLVSGANKAEPLGRLLRGDTSIPAGLIRPPHSVILADSDAARQT